MIITECVCNIIYKIWWNISFVVSEFECVGFFHCTLRLWLHRQVLSRCFTVNTGRENVNVTHCLWVIPAQKWIFSNTAETQIDLSFRLWNYKKLLYNYFPSANPTLLETPFYTLIDVLKNLKLGLWNSHTVSSQKQEPVVGQSIETSLLGSLASNLLGCSCEGHTFYHSTCSQWYIQPAETQRRTRTAPGFHAPVLCYHLFVCLSAYQT